jgi:membrane protease YdiL (CAAX protease family)
VFNCRGRGNEEPGWRGFALPCLQERYSPVVATLLLGVIWTFWHIPLLAVGPSTPQGAAGVGVWTANVSMSILNIMCTAFLLTWIYNGTRSILLALLMHGSINTANGLLIPLANNALQGAVLQTFQIVMNVTLLIAVIVVVAVTRGRLGYKTLPRDGMPTPCE